LAVAIDLLIISQILLLVERFVDLTLFSKSYQYGDFVVVQKVTSHILFVLGHLLVCDIVLKGDTLGKRIMKISAVKESMNELSLAERVARTVLKSVSLIVLPLSALVFLVNGFTIQDFFLKTVTTVKSKDHVNAYSR